MKKTNKWILFLITLSCLLVMLAGCKKESQNPQTQQSSELIVEEQPSKAESSTQKDSTAPAEESKEPSEAESTEESSAVEEIPVWMKDVISDPNMNPLTGEIEDHDVSKKRPVAFSINNHPDAVPPVGINDADIIYEAIIEGGATRMLAVFQELPNNDTPIGSIRSLRHNYIDFAACYDAIIVHCGNSNIATNELERRNYADIDAISWAGGIFYRDPWRSSQMGHVHSLVTTGQAVNDFLANDAPFRTEHEAGYACNMLFSTAPLVVDGENMNEMDIFFGDYRHSILTFDAANSDYTMAEYGETYIDYATQAPIHFKNVIVIRTDVWECDSLGHQDMTLTGEGEGYFAVNGVCAPIKWTRESEDSQFVLTYLDGTPVTFGVGKTYIAVVNLYGGIGIESE